jgi:hypothetical protein
MAARKFVVAMDWTDGREGQPWTERLVPNSGHARFRAHTTEVYVDGTGLVEVRAGRFGLGVELKPSYYRQAVKNMDALIDESRTELLPLDFGVEEGA